MIKENDIKLFPNPLIITRENEDDFLLIFINNKKTK